MISLYVHGMLLCTLPGSINRRFILSTFLALSLLSVCELSTAVLVTVLCVARWAAPSTNRSNCIAESNSHCLLLRFAAMATTLWAEQLTAQPFGLRSSSLSSRTFLVEAKPELCFPAALKFKKARAVVAAKLAKDSVRLAASGLAAVGLSAWLQFSPLAAPPAFANESTILNFGPPQDGYVLDDAAVLNRVTKSEIKGLMKDLEENQGYHVDFITVRKLTSKSDAFEFADSVLEKWYPTIEVGDKKGIVLLVTTQKEGAVTGGPAFVKAVGDKVLEAVTTENLPVLSTEEKYNEALSSTAKRLVTAIKGLPDIPGPKFEESKRESNFKTKQETEEKRGQFSAVVGGLLVIAFVVPMAQYYAYVSKK